jgi:hypothetical protein
MHPTNKNKAEIAKQRFLFNEQYTTTHPGRNILKVVHATLLNFNVIKQLNLQIVSTCFICDKEYLNKNRKMKQNYSNENFATSSKLYC